MAEKSNIEWTDASWNPSTGCNAVSEGCRHCYAETMSQRLQKAQPAGRYRNGFKFTEHDDPKILLEPLRWKKGRRIFACSMSDLFHELATDDHLDRCFAVMAAAHQHTFMVLTKRPHRMRDYLRGICSPEAKNRRGMATTVIFNNLPRLVHEELDLRLGPWGRQGFDLPDEQGFALPNVWLGTTVESQDVLSPGWYPGYPEVPGRIDALLDCPAPRRFLSCEPLLGPLQIKPWLIRNGNDAWCASCGHGHGFSNGADPVYGKISPTSGPDPRGCSYGPDCHCQTRPECDQFVRSTRAGIHLVICGGESGREARPMHPAWARSLRDQCADACVPFFFKQWGEFRERTLLDVFAEGGGPPFTRVGDADTGTEMIRVGKKAAGRRLDCCEHNDFPEAVCT